MTMTRRNRPFNPMKPIPALIPIAAFLLTPGLSTGLFAQSFPVVHWINDSGVNAAAVLSTNGVFVTDFKAVNDLKVTPLGAHSVSLYTDVFGGSSAGNNPWYCAEFVGAASNGTGDGVLGDITDLNMTSDATAALQFDFLSPLTPQDRILLIDIDGSEQYQFQAYVLSNGNYVQVSVAGWTAENLTGDTGDFPNSGWPLWNPANGTATSGYSGNLNNELFVLIPDQNINRLVVSKLAASGQSTDINFESLALPLAIERAGTNVVLSWANVPAQNYPVVHWINDSGLDAGTVLNSNGVFLTDFKAHNDFRVTPLSSDPVTLSPTVANSIDIFGGASPGNNPSYSTQFVGVPYNGTGDGVVGDIEDLTMTFDNTGALQFDFLSQLTPQDRVLLIDIDGPEQYLLKAYVLNGTNYNQVSMAGWTPQDFTGTTGELPNSTWPIWTGTNGTAYSGASGLNLDEELFVLTPDQNIDRLQIYKLAGSGWATAITFETASSALTTPAAFSLQASVSPAGPYSNVIGATSPYTNAIVPQPMYFRLKSN